jgi:hypothetical protein
MSPPTPYKTESSVIPKGSGIADFHEDPPE